MAPVADDGPRPDCPQGQSFRSSPPTSATRAQYRRCTLHDYELVLVLNPDTPDESIDGTLDRLSGFVAGHGGEVAGIDRWGRRKLAYPINRHLEGHYIVTQLRLAPSQARELEVNLRLIEEVMRHLLVRKDEE